MGLAASQARLLFITRRQADVEMGMMRNSNAQLSLSREQSNVNSQYNMMKAATKLEFQSNEITYDNLMGDAAVTLGSLNMLTDSSGAVVLNDKLADIAKSTMNTSTNPIGKGASVDQQKAFVAGASKLGLPEVEKLWDSSPKPSSSNSLWNALSQDQIKTFTRLYGKNEFGPKEAVSMDALTTTNKLGNSWGNSFVSLVSNVPLSGTECKENGLSEIKSDINTNIESLGAAAKESLKNDKKVGNKYNSSIDSSVSAMKTAWATIKQGKTSNSGSTAKKRAKNIAESNYCIGSCKNYNLFSSDDMYYAYDKKLLKEHFVASLEIHLGSAMSTVGEGNNKVYVLKPAGEYNEKGYTKTEYENLLKVFCQKYGITLSSTDSSNTDAKDKEKVSFYKAIAETIAAKGFVAPGDDKLTSENIQQQLVNGTYTINGQKASNVSGFKEVSDEKAEKEAEDWKQEQLSKINVKEKQLNVELTQLNSEYSALTTEYNSAKALIDKNIQRSFSMFQ